MSADLLTPDNTHSSRAAVASYQSVASQPASSSADPFDAVDRSNLSVSSVEAYVRAGVAPAIRRAYRADLDHFEAWGGTIPATEDMLAAYIADHATALKVSTLTRRLAAISVAHGARGLQNPVASPFGPGDDARHSSRSRGGAASGQAASPGRPLCRSRGDWRSDQGPQGSGVVADRVRRRPQAF